MQSQLFGVTLLIFIAFTVQAFAYEVQDQSSLDSNRHKREFPRSPGIAAVNGAHRGCIKIDDFCENLRCPEKNISYLVGTQKVSWFQAFVLCKQNGMELASITTNDEQIAIEKVLIDSGTKDGFHEGYWLSGTRHGACNSDFVWFTTGMPVIYRRFASGQPDHYKNNEHCLQILQVSQKKVEWNDLPCNALLKFICQNSNCSFSGSLPISKC